MALKFRRGTTAQKSGSLAFGEPYVNTTLGTLQIGLESGDATLTALGTGSSISVAGISGSSLDITGNAKIDGDLSLGGKITIGDASSDTVNVVASLSSSLIPQTTNAFDLGSADKIWKDLYISTGSIKFVDGNTIVKSLSLSTLTALEASTGSLNTSVSNLISTASNHEQRLDTFESESGSFAKTNISNTFANDQTFSGSINLTGRVRAGLAVSASALHIHTTNGNSQVELVNSTTGRGFHLISYDGDSFSIHNPTTGQSAFRIDSGSQYHSHFFGDINVLSGSISSSAGFSGSINGIGDVTTYSASVKTINDSQTTSISNLNSYTSSLQAGIQMTGSTVSFLGNIVVYGTQSVINSENVQISDNILYLSPTASIDNDLGIVGHYNDGTYRHAGIFMDASDGHAWKVFNGLTTETSAQIDTSGNGFTLADFKAGAITGTSFTGPLTGNASTATTLQTARTINGTSFNGSTDITIPNLVSGSSQITLSGVAGYSTLATSYEQIAGASHTLVSGSSQIQLGSASGNIALSTQTTGDYVASLVAGTGVTITNNSGEGATPTIAIGQAIASSSSPTFAGLTINGAITATGDITAYYSSDRRYKNNIQIIPNALEKVSKLNGVTWEWNDDVNEVTKQAPKTGLIAQEVLEVLPEVVKQKEDGFLGLDYAKMMGLLVEAIKEQQTQIEELKAKLGYN